MQNLQALGALPPHPRRWGLRPQTRGYAPRPPHCEFLATRLATFTRFRSFYFEQFFLGCSVANLMMLTTTYVRLLLNCFLLKKFCLHYALRDFDFILWHGVIYSPKYQSRKKFFESLLKTPPIEKSCVRRWTLQRQRWSCGGTARRIKSGLKREWRSFQEEELGIWNRLRLCWRTWGFPVFTRYDLTPWKNQQHAIDYFVVLPILLFCIRNVKQQKRNLTALRKSATWINSKKNR